LGLKGRRDKVFVLAKVCALMAATVRLAMQMREQSLRRLQTDHLDLSQVHGVVFQNDPELFLHAGGAAEALPKRSNRAKYACRLHGP
jgi:aryl-alcohol dehydrogenase-like predicted oxidoreductase